MKKPILIYADFMKCDDEGRLVLVCYGTHKDLEEHKITLEEGIKLVLLKLSHRNSVQKSASTPSRPAGLKRRWFALFLKTKIINNRF